jgi:hypothetical protein
MNFRLFLLSFALTFNAFGWGDIGHRIVGDIADQTIKKSTKQKIKKFFGEETLATASTWPDEIKSDFEKRLELGKKWGHDHGYTDPSKIAGIINSWHYTSIPDNMKYADSPKVKTGDIVSAIKKMVKILKSNKSLNKEKREALRMLTHFVGDIHQPLHVGNGKDRGANRCYISWFPPYKAPPIAKAVMREHEYVNLHALWDSKIIVSMSLSFSEYAKKLLIPNPATLSQGDPKMEAMYSDYSGKELNKLHKEKVKVWLKTSVVDWANESKALRQIAYLGKTKPNDSSAKFCIYTDTDKLNPEDIPQVSYDFRYSISKVINYRLLQSGVRLAKLLDSIF